MKSIVMILAFACLATASAQTRPSPPERAEFPNPYRGKGTSTNQQLRKERERAERGWWADPFKAWGPAKPVAQSDRTFLVGYTQAQPRAEYPRDELVVVYEAVREQYRETVEGPVSRWVTMELGVVAASERNPGSLLYQDASETVQNYPPLKALEGEEISQARFVELLKEGHTFEVIASVERDCPTCFGRGQTRGREGKRVDVLVDCSECRATGKLPHLVRYTVRWQ